MIALLNSKSKSISGE